MCGRYGLFPPPEEITRLFGLDSPGSGSAFTFQESFNIAPSQIAPVAIETAEGRRLGGLRWGLFVGSLQKGRKQINARSETVHSSPAFRTAFERRRCVVPASGFYEWRVEGSGKVPYWIAPRDGGILAMAGIWGRDPEEAEEGQQRRTGTPGYAVLTRAANDAIRIIHKRMPVILPPRAIDVWLRRKGPVDDLRAALRTEGAPLTAYPVSTLVNRPANNVPECVLPVGDPIF